MLESFSTVGRVSKVLTRADASAFLVQSLPAEPGFLKVAVADRKQLPQRRRLMLGVTGMAAEPYSLAGVLYSRWVCKSRFSTLKFVTVEARLGTQLAKDLQEAIDDDCPTATYRLSRKYECLNLYVELPPRPNGQLVSRSVYDSAGNRIFHTLYGIEKH